MKKIKCLNKAIGCNCNVSCTYSSVITEEEWEKMKKKKEKRLCPNCNEFSLVAVEN